MMGERNGDNYSVTFVFEYCTITASCLAEDAESAPDLAWDWVVESIGLSGRHYDRVLETVVEALEAV
jgi:hypothetical protein